MAYDAKELEKKAIEAIKKNKLIFLEEVISYLPCNRGTFYLNNLNKLDSILELLEENKIEEKVKLRKKWRGTDNAALNLALYKLCSSDEEQAKLNPNKVDTTVNIYKNTLEEDLTKLSTDELKRRIQEAAKEDNQDTEDTEGDSK